MNGGRTDASTSTSNDDVKGRPLCLFYFTHPFGVLSPEPPTVTSVAAAAPHVARAFLNMQPVSPFRSFTSPSDAYDTTSTSRPAYDLGDTTVHRNPVHLVRNYPLDPSRDSMSSSLFSGEVWFSSSGSSRPCGGERRVVPYNRILPPLQLPTPRDLAWDSSDDVWPTKCSTREKFSLPPIELPRSVCGVSEVDLDRVLSECGSGSLRRVTCCRHALVGRHRRARLSGVQRMVTCLMKRTIKVFTIAAVGLLWGCLYCFLFTGAGAGMSEELGMREEVCKGMQYVHGVLGILLLVVNMVLLAAAAYEIDSLCEVYLWFMVVFWTTMLVSTLTVATYAAVDSKFTFAGVYILVMFCALVLTTYCTVVVGNYRMTLP